MDWTEALEIVIDRTKHERYRTLTADDHPDHVIHRRRVLEMAGGDPGPALHYPPVATMAGNLLGAIGRTVAAVATGQAVKVTQEEHDRRYSVCLECPELDKEQNRCRRCGCALALKPWLTRESCPLEKW
jgi:Family of unknown function (DUF6171)